MKQNFAEQVRFMLTGRQTHLSSTETEQKICPVQPAVVQTSEFRHIARPSFRKKVNEKRKSRTVHAHAIEKSSRTCNRTPGTWPKSAVRSKKEAEKVESIEGTTVLLGGFVFCLGFRVLVFLLFLEQKCSLKNTRASISRFSSDELSISTFFPTLLKSMENSTCSSRILWHFQAQASTWCFFGRAVSQRSK